MRDSAKTKRQLIDELRETRARLTDIERERDRLELLIEGSNDGLWDWPHLNDDRSRPIRFGWRAVYLAAHSFWALLVE